MAVNQNRTAKREKADYCRPTDRYHWPLTRNGSQFDLQLRNDWDFRMPWASDGAKSLAWPGKRRASSLQTSTQSPPAASAALASPGKGRQEWLLPC